MGVVLGSICVRGGSEGVKRKNIRELLGHPLIEYTIRCAEMSKALDDFAISSDDDEILEISKNLGCKNVFKRPDHLATSAASKWPVFVDLLEQFEGKHKVTVDYLVDLDVTVPLRKPHHIDECMEVMLKTKADVVITSHESERNPYFNMMEEKDNGYFGVVNKSQTPIVRRQDAPKVYSLTPAVFLCSREALYKYDHWSNARCVLHPMDRLEAVDIDTEMDFRLTEFLLEKGYVQSVMK